MWAEQIAINLTGHCTNPVPFSNIVEYRVNVRFRPKPDIHNFNICPKQYPLNRGDSAHYP